MQGKGKQEKVLEKGRQAEMWVNVALRELIHYRDKGNNYIAGVMRGRL